MRQTLPNAQVDVDDARTFSVADWSARDKRLDAPGALRLWHLTSLDAPTVAVVWSLGFAWAGGVRLPVWIPVLLALAGWAVYIGDRLMDARTALRNGDFEGLRERHLFHYRHWRVLAPLAVCAAAGAAAILLTLMPAAARGRNSVLAAAALLYFTGVHSARRPAWMERFWLAPIFKKELLVGVLFTAACALPALSRVAAQARLPLITAAVFFALLAWLNCHAIDRWESLTYVLRPWIFRLACFLALAGLVTAILLIEHRARAAALVLTGVASSMLLAGLDRLRNRLCPLALRAAADLVLLTPLALLWR